MRPGLSEITVQEMCAEMVVEDFKVARCHAFLKEHGLELPVAMEMITKEG